MRAFVESGLLDPAHPVDLWDFERWQMVDMNGVEEGLVIQNLMLATQALGIGGHPFSGGKGRVTMGGEKHWHGIGGDGPCGSLGFTFHQVPDDAPVGAAEEIPSGSRGSSRAPAPLLPPRHGRRGRLRARPPLGADGIFSAPEAQQDPWRSAEIARAVPRPSEEAIEATKTLCRYIWDTYGRFPATVDPFLMTVWYQAAHLDVDFYDRYYPVEALPRARPLAHARLARPLDDRARRPRPRARGSRPRARRHAPGARLAYRTHGTLSATRDNAVLFPHMYSGTQASLDCWIGPGRPLDPDRWFVVCPGQLGNGDSTSPSQRAAPSRT